MEHSHLTADASASGWFDQSRFMPHGHCYLWEPALVATHVISDLLIGLAYLSISVTLYVLVRQIRLPFSPIFVAFGVFIGACGLTHFMEIWTLWHADYWAAGMVKAVTALASVATGAALIPLRAKVAAFADAARVSEERRVRLETAHAELEKLYEQIRESDLVKTQFFANVSHELRTPIALILGPIEGLLANQDASKNLSPEQTRALEGALRNSRTLLKQVNDLLDISKLEAGRMKPLYAATDLAKLLRFVAAHFESAMQERGIFFSMDAPESAKAEVDPDKIQRVYMNLISNAVKFAPDGGRIRVALRLIGGDAVVSVEDSGPGVPAHIRHRLFERFTQGEGGANRRFGGTGLGLAIVKDFVEMHGGDVRLVERGGPGAKFAVRLPLRAPPGVAVSDRGEAETHVADPNLEGTVAQVSPASSPAELARPFDPSRATILVCEDNPDMSCFVCDLLAADFNVAAAHDGRDGLAKAEALRPDLVLSDVMMPNLSGEELVSELRRDPALSGIPVLLLSARADDEMRARLLRQGASDYVVKPFAAEELRARVWNLLAVKRARDVLRSELDLRTENVVELARELAARKRQIEAALEAAQAARGQVEMASREKGLFMKLISHELNTPLSAMLLAVQLLEARESSRMPASANDLVGHLARAGRQLKGLVDGLLQYLDSGATAEHRIEKVSSGLLARDAAREHEAAARRKGISIRCGPIDGPGDGSTEVEFALSTDPGIARAILRNLVDNAVKFTERGFVEISARKEGEWAVFSVRDSGVGVAREELQRIFEPFERIEALDRKSAPGVGLGLAIARKLATSLGGEIQARSIVGDGSVFALRLPLAPADAASAVRRDRSLAEEGAAGQREPGAFGLRG